LPESPYHSTQFVERQRLGKIDIGPRLISADAIIDSCSRRHDDESHIAEKYIPKASRLGLEFVLATEFLCLQVFLARANGKQKK
jgi:hypothetical protein